MHEKSLNVVPLTPELLPLTENFSSGNTYIDSFIKNGDCSLNTNIGKSYVFLSKKGTEIIGFYNLSVSSLDQLQQIKERQYRVRMGGSININYFALDEKYHKQIEGILPSGTNIYLSDLLIDECFERIEMITQNYVGATFVTLNSTNEGLHLYTRNGFEYLEEDMTFTMEESDYDCIQLYRWINEEF